MNFIIFAILNRHWLLVHTEKIFSFVIIHENPPHGKLHLCVFVDFCVSSAKTAPRDVYIFPFVSFMLSCMFFLTFVYLPTWKSYKLRWSGDLWFIHEFKMDIKPRPPADHLYNLIICCLPNIRNALKLFVALQTFEII